MQTPPRANSVNGDPEEYVKELERQVHEVLPAQWEALCALNNMVQTCPCFDQNDITYVRGEMEKFTEHFEKSKLEWQRAHQLVYGTIANMKKTMEQRHAELDRVNETTNLFSLFPDITRHFAQKQAELVRVYETANRQIVDHELQKMQ